MPSKLYRQTKKNTGEQVNKERNWILKDNKVYFAFGMGKGKAERGYFGYYFSNEVDGLKDRVLLPDLIEGNVLSKKS